MAAATRCREASVEVNVYRVQRGKAKLLHHFFVLSVNFLVSCVIWSYLWVV